MLFCQQQPYIHKLRWRLDYVDGVIRRGLWNAPNRNLEYDAYGRHFKISYAMIEAGELDHNRIGNTLIAPKPIVVVDGENFCIFQWTASTSKAFNGQGCYNRLTGLKIKTRDEDIIVSFFDRKIIRQPRSEADKNINFKAYGK